MQSLLDIFQGENCRRWLLGNRSRGGRRCEGQRRLRFRRRFGNRLQSALGDTQFVTHSRQVLTEELQTVLQDHLLAAEFLQPRFAQLVEFGTLGTHLSRLGILNVSQIVLLSLSRDAEFRLRLSDARVEFFSLTAKL